MKVMTLIWDLILVRIKFGNLPVIVVDYDGQARFRITWGVVEIKDDLGRSERAVTLLNVDDLEEMLPPPPPKPVGGHLTVIK